MLEGELVVVAAENLVAEHLDAEHLVAEHLVAEHLVAEHLVAESQGSQRRSLFLLLYVLRAMRILSHGADDVAEDSTSKCV